MSNFTPLVEKIHTFEGDEIRVTFSRLRRKHILKLMPLIQSLDHANSKKDKSKVDVIQSDLLGQILEILPEHIKEFTGLKDKDGNAISFDTVADDTYFLNLSTDIGMQLIEESLPMMGSKGKNG